LGNLCTLWRWGSRYLSLLACICGNFRGLAVENNFGLFEVTSCICIMLEVLELGKNGEEKLTFVYEHETEVVSC
jgi:hypothetical protein